MVRSNPTQTEESKVSLNQRQFGIRHLLVATLVAAFAISMAPHLRNVPSGYRNLVCFGATIVIGTYTRWLGWELNWPSGSIGRHAIAFFSAVMGCASMIVLLNYDGSWSDVIDKLPQGLGVGAMFGGILFGAGIESTFLWRSAILSANMRSLRPENEIQKHGEPFDEPKSR